MQEQTCQKIYINPFTDTFTQIHCNPLDFSPSTVDDDASSFDADNLLSLLDHAA